MDSYTDGKIVIVDDMQIIVNLVKEILEESGLTNIVIFTDPLVAVESIKRNIKPALVITDYNMPGMNGLELLDIVSQTFPTVAGILMSTETEKLIGTKRIYYFIDKQYLSSKRFINLVATLLNKNG